MHNTSRPRSSAWQAASYDRKSCSIEASPQFYIPKICNEEGSVENYVRRCVLFAFIPGASSSEGPYISPPSLSSGGSLRTTSGRPHAPSPPTWNGQSAVPPPRKAGLYSPPIRLCITLELAQSHTRGVHAGPPQYASTTKDDGCASSLLALLPHPATRTSRRRRYCVRSID
ncbi:hypothetical protein K466DRAFT_159669 [Polyporus arcularius HHB13444]|uniref:Uncharacterized protein n=1 Tax=Polyporus arcularius HHB13444 TaxID=1314778 RepID=A0A5C3P936_9APHY|nr:hypothetical protein K466DRAFT_159669 [Polyporus arcularius HHB13444]